MCNCLWSWHSCNCFSIEVLDTAHESVHKHDQVVHNVENEQIGFYDCRRRACAVGCTLLTNSGNIDPPEPSQHGVQGVCSADKNGLSYKEYVRSRVSKQQLAVCLRRAGWLALLDREESQQHSKIASSQCAQSTENGHWSGEAPKCRLRCPY